MEHSPARSRSRVLEGSPNHDADSVHVVSSDRPQPAEVCAEYLQSDRRRFRSGDAACLLLRELALASRFARHALILAQTKTARIAPGRLRLHKLLLAACIAVLTQPRRQ